MTNKTIDMTLICLASPHTCVSVPINMVSTFEEGAAHAMPNLVTWQ